eukprot:scaffold21290_cov156-Skeletonema_marinoi.AAC.3
MLFNCVAALIIAASYRYNKLLVLLLHFYILLFFSAPYPMHATTLESRLGEGLRSNNTPRPRLVWCIVGRIDRGMGFNVTAFMLIQLEWTSIQIF